jgi:hypothetical protein
MLSSIRGGANVVIDNTIPYSPVISTVGTGLNSITANGLTVGVNASITLTNPGNFQISSFSGSSIFNVDNTNVYMQGKPFVVNTSTITQIINGNPMIYIDSYLYIPTNTLVQWGYRDASANNGITTVMYAIPFGNTPKVYITPYNINGTNTIISGPVIQYQTQTVSEFKCDTNPGSGYKPSIYWLAIGIY